MLDGKELTDDSTPNSVCCTPSACKHTDLLLQLDLEEGDIIEVMTKQTGGR